MNILEQIVQNKKLEIQKLDKNRIRDNFQHSILKQLPSFKQAIQGKTKISVIAELKKASPSRGVLVQDFDPLRLARQYAEAGASALSVLTDVKYFQGSMEYLKLIAEKIKLPLLCKDFILDPVQIYLAKQNGASAVLLIAAILSLPELRDLLKLARELQMDALVEVHNEKELGLVLHTSADIIGINNRDLQDFSIDLRTTARLAPLIPDTKVIVSESGIKNIEDIPPDVDAVLIGEGLLKNSSLLKKS